MIYYDKCQRKAAKSLNLRSQNQQIFDLRAAFTRFTLSEGRIFSSSLLNIILDLILWGIFFMLVGLNKKCRCGISKQTVSLFVSTVNNENGYLLQMDQTNCRLVDQHNIYSHFKQESLKVTCLRTSAMDVFVLP